MVTTVFGTEVQDPENKFRKTRMVVVKMNQLYSARTTIAKYECDVIRLCYCSFSRNMLSPSYCGVDNKSSLAGGAMGENGPRFLQLSRVVGLSIAK